MGNRALSAFAAGVVALGAIASTAVEAAGVAVGRDQSLELSDPSITRVEVLASQALPGHDPNALLSPFTGQGPCLTYAYDDALVLNQEVRLALFDASDNVVGLPIITVDNSYFNSVDASCGVVVVPNQQPIAVDDNFGTNYVGANVLANDIDPDGDPLTAVLLTPPTAGSVVLNANGTFVYTPPAGFSGDVTFTYEAFDGTDGSTSPGIVSLTVVAVVTPNQAPVAVADDFGTSYAGANVLANDSDPDGDALLAALITGTTNGVVVLNTDGTFQYTPNDGFFGSDSFSYRATDGTLLSDTVTATLEVAEPPPPPPPPPTNGVPRAEDDDFGADYEGANVLDNDSDPDGDPLTAILVSDPSRGSVTLNPDGTFEYIPELGYTGPDSFTYRASDGVVPSEIATVSLIAQLPATNLPPVGGDDDFAEDYENGNLLDNDLDPNNDTLIAILVTPTEFGDLELREDGSFTYRPFAGYAGPDSFTYKVRDRPLGDPTGLESDPILVRLQVDPSAAAADGVTGKIDADGTSVLGGASANELRTSRRIDQICPRIDPQTPDQEDLQRLCTNLRAQGTTAKQALVALRAITPEELSAISKAFRVLSFSRFRNIGARISRVRDGESRGVSIAGLNIRAGDTLVSGNDIQSALSEGLAAMGLGASADEEGGEDLLREYSRLGLFIRGDLNFGEGDETELESGFDFDAQTLTVGADYRINDNLFAGASVSLGQSEVDFANNGGETTTDNYSVALYGSLYSGNGYLDGIVSYGWSDVETERNIFYTDFGGTVDRVAEGSSDGDEYYISFNAGYNFNWGALNVDPLARFFYLDGSVDPFTETGAGGWNLAIDEQEFESLSLSAGGQVSYTFLPSWGVITPYLRIEYTREFEDSAGGVRYRFANDPLGQFNDTNGMRIEADDPDTGYMVYGAGVAAQFIHGISGFVNYQALGSYDNLSGEILSFGARWEAHF
ncbi:tandem-95 repeat protein [Parahaliea maris]|uniref:Tandem-95 repeat protein n=1 Tax=Parahaliea maris TaxID=2716870 RepID=A0A5C9A802_9GAMM|nr:Ig-like domain-containing protein [Parahaliea maris]TXS95351.1 tandem-95 repeat protein [Parahaliea maris]